MKEVPEGFVRVRRPKPNPFNEMVGPEIGVRARFQKKNDREIGL